MRTLSSEEIEPPQQQNAGRPDGGNFGNSAQAVLMDEAKRIEKQLDVHVQEAAGLGSEIGAFTQRIHRIMGLYLAAAFGIIGVLLHPNAPPAFEYLSRAEKDSFVVGLMLLLPSLNSVLLIHVASFMHFIYAAGKYITFDLRPRVERLVQAEVWAWSTWESRIGDRQLWIQTRSLVAVMYYLLATGISLAILYRFSDALRLKRGWIPLLLYISATLVVSLSSVVACMNFWMGRHFAEADRAERTPDRARWYWIAIPVATALLFLFAYFGHRRL